MKHEVGWICWRAVGRAWLLSSPLSLSLDPTCSASVACSLARFLSPSAHSWCVDCSLARVVTCLVWHIFGVSQIFDRSHMFGVCSEPAS